MQKHFSGKTKQKQKHTIATIKYLPHDLWTGFQGTGSADKVRSPTGAIAIATDAKLFFQPQQGRKGCSRDVYSMKETNIQAERGF